MLSTTTPLGYNCVGLNKFIVVGVPYSNVVSLVPVGSIALIVVPLISKVSRLVFNVKSIS